MKVKVSVQGQQAMDRLLKEYAAKGRARVSAITQITANEIATEAMRNVPVNYGKIKQSINVRQDSELKFSVFVNAVPIAAYVEFGTGAFVEVAPEWKDMAWEFYVNGKGKLSPRPYLYPAYRRGVEQYEKDLIHALKQLDKK